MNIDKKWLAGIGLALILIGLIGLASVDIEPTPKNLIAAVVLVSVVGVALISFPTPSAVLQPLINNTAERLSLHHHILILAIGTTVLALAEIYFQGLPNFVKPVRSTQEVVDQMQDDFGVATTFVSKHARSGIDLAEQAWHKAWSEQQPQRPEFRMARLEWSEPFFQETEIEIPAVPLQTQSESDKGPKPFWVWIAGIFWVAFPVAKRWAPPLLPSQETQPPATDAGN